MGFNGTNDFVQFMRPVDPHWKTGGAQKIAINLVSSNTVGAVTACVQVVSLGAGTNWPPSAANWGGAAVTNIPIACNSVIGNLQTSGLIAVNTFSNVTTNQELAIRVSASQTSTNFEFESLEVEYDTQ